MPWEFDSDRPVFIQLVEKIMDDIFVGKYEPGSQLPSVRDMAITASVNPNTMQKALAELERTNLVYSKRTSGRYVTEDISLIDSMKHARAQDKINAFLNDMKNIGIERNEVIDILIKEGETHE